MIVIYDNTGFILLTMETVPQELMGIPTLEVEIPQGKFIKSVDVSVTPNEPVFADLPKTETQLLKEENTDIKLALAELAEIVVGGAI